MTADELLGRLQRAGVPSARVSTMDQVATEPQTEASGMLPAVKHPRLPDYRAVALPIKWDGERPRPRRGCRRCSGSTRPRCWPSWATIDAAIRGLVERHVIQL